MHTGARAPPSRNPDLSVHNRRITYLLGPCPGGPRHDGIDYANSRNRPSWPKPPRNYASTPSDSASLSPSLSIFFSPLLSLSFSFGPLFWTFSLLLYSHSVPSLRPSLNLYTLPRLSSSIKDCSRSIAQSVLLPPPPFSPLPRSVPLSLGLLCNQNNNNLLRNCFDCSSIWVITGYPWLYVGPFSDPPAAFLGTKGEREAVSSYLRCTLRIRSMGDALAARPISSNDISSINRYRSVK